MSGIIEKLGITTGPWEGICLHDDGCKCGYIFNEIEACIGKAYFNDPSHDGYIKESEVVTLEQARNNQRVMSSAPEMLEALINLTIDSINTEFNEIHPRYSRSYDDKWISDYAEKRFTQEISIIEKATGKTWQQIKELL